MEYSARKGTVSMQGESSVPEIETAEVASGDAKIGLSFARQAASLIDAGDLDAAYDLLQAGIRQFPNYAAGVQVLGDLYVERGKPVSATFAYLEALKRDADNPLTLVKLGDLFRTAGQLTEALKYYLQAAHLEPNSPAIRARLEELGRYGADPGRPDHEILLTETAADLYAQQGYKDKARAIYARLLQESPGDPRLFEKLKSCS